MEIRRWLCYIFLKYVVVQYLSAKTVSLNELIKAEARRKEEAGNLQATKLTDTGVTSISINENTVAVKQKIRERIKPPARKLTSLLKRIPLFKRLASNSKIRNQRKDRATLHRNLLEGKNLSLQRYRKEFQIKSPLKPKKLRLGLNSRQQKNQSTKREINGNGHLKQKYIPLLKSLNMLFNNIIGSDASASNEIKTKNYKRNRVYSKELFQENDSREDWSFRSANSKSQKKTIASPSISTEISSDTENLTPSKDYDYSTVRPNKSLSILLPRNTLGSRRDNNGSSKRSRSSYNRNIEGNITRDYGSHRHNTRFGENKTYAESNENNTHSTTRNDTSGIGYPRTGRNRNNAQNSRNSETNEFIKPKNENANDIFRKNQFKNRGNQAESKIVIREPVRRLRGYIPEGESAQGETTTSEFIQHQKIYEEGILSTANFSASHKRITDKSSPNTTKDEKIGPRNETMILIESYYPQTESYLEGKGKMTPAVLIYDGYSITRDINGENKVAGKTIHIRS